jgi:phage-related minor tail protein
VASLDAGIISLFVGPKLVSDFAGKLGQQVDSAIGPVADKAAKSFGDKLSGGLNKAGKGLTAGVTAPILAVGATAIAAGMEVDGAFDAIRVGTGATGDTLAQLQEDFKAVATSSAGELGRVGDVIADLNTRLGITGEPLQALAGQIVDLEQVTGEAANLDTITRVLGAFNVPAEEAGETLDKLFRASQATGVGFNDLSGLLVSQSAAFAELGFGLDETAALLGQFEKAGVNTGTVLAGLRANIVKAASEGKSAAEFFRDGVTTIEGYIAAGDDASAQAAARELFGARTFLDALDAIKRGQFNIDDTIANIQEGQDSISGLADETADFPEQLQKLKNTAAIALLPIAEQLIPAISSAVEAVLPVVKQLADAFGNLSPETQRIIVIAGGVAAAIGPLLLIAAKLVTSVQAVIGVVKLLNLAFLTSPVGLIIAGIAFAAALIIMNWDKIGPFFADLWQGIQDTFEAFVGYLSDAWQGLLIVVDAVWEGIKTGAEFVVNLIVGYFTFWFNTYKAIWDGALALVQAVWDGIRTGAEFVVNLLVGYFTFWFNLYKTIWDSALAIVQTVWEGIRAGAEAVVNAVAAYFNFLFSIYARVWEGIKAGFSVIATFISGIWQRLQAGFQVVATFLTSTAQTVGQAIIAPFQVVGDFVAGIWAGIQSAAQSAVNFVVGIFTGLIDTVRGVIDTILNLPGISQVSGILGSVGGFIAGARAEGGPVDGNKPYLVGEMGPEIVVPRTSGTVIPNDMLGQLGGGSTTYNVTVNNPTAEPTSDSIPAALRRANYLRAGAMA